MTQDDWQTLDRRHVWHPYTQMLNAAPPLPVERAEGIYLYTSDGQRMVDGISSWWVNVHGHNIPEINTALQAQAQKMAHVMYAGIAHAPGARLAAALSHLAPGNLPHVFYSDNGSTAVEVAMKMAYQSFVNRGDTQRRTFVAFCDAYHGDTFGAMAVGGVALFGEAFGDLLFDVRRAHGQTCPREQHRRACSSCCPDSLTNILAAEAHTVAGVIVEPMVQGAGGMRIWDAAAVRAVGGMCKAHGVLLIADEVFVGFGRTGTMFACSHADLQPDILCLSKALTAGYLPLGATLASDAIYTAFLSASRGKTLFHGHSFAGNPLACAVAEASLSYFAKADWLPRVAQLEKLYASHLRTLAALPGVQGVRNIGALAVVELAPREGAGYLDTAGAAVTHACQAQGVWLRPLGNVVYVLAPYCITDAQVAHLFAVLKAAIEATCA